ncbi:MAG: TetR/AcrR family transcriptional regulator [Piscirickettsiaceae bacterium]|nr:TetR/AcrR family transcriptional regulator [Piscirickettsiaceae bacterium]
MATERNPENTRNRILHAAFKEMHRHGYQGLRIDAVLKETGLKKGALYHHFTGKQALGYAVLEELIQKRVAELWITPLDDYDDPIAGIKSIFTTAGESWGDTFFSLGCPLNNLAQEMSPIDEGFRTSIESFMSYWKKEIVEALTRGQNNGVVKKDINLNETAQFIITVAEGAFAQAKISQDKEVFFKCGQQLNRYLDTLTS